MNVLKRMLLVCGLVLALTSQAFAAEKIDINSATATELAAGLDGIGEKKAAAIVAYRESQGKFTSLDQLENAQGIGRATVGRLRDQLTLGQVDPRGSD